MVLHLAKYAGRSLSGGANFRQTLTDAFVISLACANILNLQLADRIQHRSHQMNAEQFGHRLAVLTGAMAKACEALDHLEQYDSKGVLNHAIQEVCDLCRNTAESMQFDLAAEANARWAQIEARQVVPSGAEK